MPRERHGHPRRPAADHAINYKDTNFVERVTALVGNAGIDVVLDPVGGKTLQDSAALLRYRGRIVTMGLSGRDTSLFNAYPLWGKNASLTGMTMTTSLTYEHDRMFQVVADCIARVAKGELRVFVDRTFPLAEASAAHAYIEGRTAFGRVLMVP